MWIQSSWEDRWLASAQVCSGNPLGGQPHPPLMPRVCTHGRTPGPGSRPRLCPRPLVKGSTVCLGFLPPLNPPRRTIHRLYHKEHHSLLIGCPWRQAPRCRKTACFLARRRVLPSTHTDRPWKEGGRPQDQGSVLPCTWFCRRG